MFYKSEGEENCIENKNINKTDKASTKHSTGHCKKRNKLSTRRPAISSKSFADMKK